ncbi:MAG: DUF5018 domain-containing protein [Treponema sp.]|jgi:hypothetical protein|nr:DUF5018 domain-containing protein [Treponema sp.]
MIPYYEDELPSLRGSREILASASALSDKSAQKRHSRAISMFFISIFVIFMAAGCDFFNNSMSDYFLDNTGTVDVTGVAGKTLSAKMADGTIFIPPEDMSTIGVAISNPRNFDIRYELMGVPAGKDIAARRTRSNEIEVSISGAVKNDEYNLTLAMQSSDGLRNFPSYPIRLKCVSFETNLLDFKVNGETPPSFDPVGGSFTVNIPYKMESVTLEGISVDPDAVVEIFSGTEGSALAKGTRTAETMRTLDIGNNYFYIEVTAPSSSVQGYAITVYRGESSDKAIMNFDITAPAPAAGIINEESHSIAVAVPYGTDITGMSARVVHLGESISPDPEAMRSYAGPVTYTVTAADGTSQNYTVTASVAKIASIEKIEGKLTSPDGFAKTGVDISGAIKAAITLATGTDSLGAAIALDPADYSVDILIPSSTGTTEAASLRVPAAKSSTGADIVKTFDVYIKSDAAEITELYFAIGGKRYGVGSGTEANSGCVSGTAITVTVPYGTAPTGLAPTVAISPGASTEPPAGTVWGSSGSKTYTVTAEDGASRNYTVTVNVEPAIAVSGIVNPSFSVLTFTGSSFATAGAQITITINKDAGSVSAWHIDISGPTNSTGDAATFNAPTIAGFYNVTVIVTVDGIDYSGSFALTIE